MELKSWNTVGPSKQLETDWLPVSHFFLHTAVIQSKLDFLHLAENVARDSSTAPCPSQLVSCCLRHKSKSPRRDSLAYFGSRVTDCG